MKLAEIANERDIEPILLSTIAITSAKGMKHEHFITNDVRESVDFLDVEGVIAHLMNAVKRAFGLIFQGKEG